MNLKGGVDDRRGLEETNWCEKDCGQRRFYLVTDIYALKHQ
jgi:hypothetical protein